MTDTDKLPTTRKEILEDESALNYGILIRIGMVAVQMEKLLQKQRGRSSEYRMLKSTFKGLATGYLELHDWSPTFAKRHPKRQK